MKNLSSVGWCLIAIIFFGLSGADRIARSASLKGNLVIIYDASGSMSYDLEGKPGHETVSAILSEAIRELPSDLNVGLIAFGHQRQGDCDDAAELIPVGPLNKDALTEALHSITPRGMSSISLSLRKAGDVLKKRHDSGNAVLLIADGKDGCMNDPCSAAAQIIKEKPQIKIHVIGLAVSPSDAKQLECIAAEGNGVYASCQNAESFRSSVRQALGLPENVSETAKSEPSAITPPSESPAGAEDGRKTEAFSAVCAARGCRLRQSPSPDSAIVLTMKKGDILTVDDVRQDWYHVKLPGGQTGWAHQSIIAGKTADDPIRTSEKKTVGKVREVRVEITPEGEEKVIVAFSDVYLPKTSKLQEAVPKLICDFTGVRPGADIPPHQQVGGKILQAVRTGYHKDTNVFRLALDLVPNQPYEINQNFMIKTNQYVIVLKKTEGEY